MENVKQRKKTSSFASERINKYRKKRESDVIVPPVARQRYSISFTSQLTGYVDTTQYNTEQRRKKFLLLPSMRNGKRDDDEEEWNEVEECLRVVQLSFESCDLLSHHHLSFFQYIRKHKQSIIYSQWDSCKPTTTANSPSIYIVIMLLPAHRRAPHSIYANTPWTSLSAFSLDAYVRRDASWWESSAYPWGLSWHWGHREVSANVWTS